MIDVICSTQLDAFKNEDWPTEMACRPNVGDVGDGVQAASGKKLYVMDITHFVSKAGKPILLIELHNRAK